MIYLDNSATTRVRPEVVDAMVPYLHEKWGNPSSLHRAGQEAKSAMATARQQVAALLNCEPDEIFFTPGGTYANNVAILGRARFAQANNHGRHLITSAIEHPAVMGPVQHLESLGWKVTYLPVDKEGFVDPETLATAITSQTSMISIMWANNEIGTVQPIHKLAQIAAHAGVYFHTDAIQVPGKIPIDLGKLEASTLSISGHKFHAPKGIGVLFVRKGTNVMPLVFGGGQEQGLFPGTEPVANIVAIGKAAELCLAELEQNVAKMLELQEIFLHSFNTVPGLKLTGPVDIERRLAGHVSLTIAEVEGESIVMQAALRNVCISSGSACHQGMLEPSHILKAIGLSSNEAKGSVRISCGRFNSNTECSSAAVLLTELFNKLRSGARAKAYTG